MKFLLLLLLASLAVLFVNVESRTHMLAPPSRHRPQGNSNSTSSDSSPKPRRHSPPPHRKFPGNGSKRPQKATTVAAK
ncbi:unnamed protein product [Caenorhabditis sp. 36 PRJEB53466]|nr:unnamed protein product [Caenorhabditis sp. 36 PRJEB53466]